jgi:hypothetical protein
MNPLYLIIGYISLIHLGPLLTLASLLPHGRVYPITTTGHVLMIYLTFRYFKGVGRKGLSRLDLLVIGFLFWSLASFILFFQKDNPCDITAYFYGVHLYVMPIFGYFAVKLLSIKEQQKALRFFLWSNMFTIVLGLYLWWAKPDFYTVFLRENVFHGMEGWADWMVYARLQSYISSTTVGALCAISVALAGAIGTSPGKTIFILVASLTAAILTYQRGGQMGTLIAVAYLIAWGRGSRTTRLLILTGGILAVGVAIVALTQNSDVGLEYYLERKSDYNSSIWENRRGYTVGIDYITAFPLGVGLGGSGNAANDAGLQQWDKVVDANFMRIFADLGVEGILLFLAMIAVGVHTGLRKRRNPGLTCILFVYAVVCLGTNVLDGHLTPQLFYLFLGMVDVPADRPELAIAPAAEPQETDASPVAALQPATQNAQS